MGNYEDAQTVLSFRVPTEQALWVKERAEASGMSVNKALRLWLTETINRAED